MICHPRHQHRAGTGNRRTQALRAQKCSWFLLACGVLLLAGVANVVSSADLGNAGPGAGQPPSSSVASPLPRIAPDYLDVMIPPNLAPLNLVILEPGAEYQLRVSASRGQPITLRQSQPRICLPLAAWKDLLQTNRGGVLRWDIAVRNAAGEWVPRAPFETRVAEEDIDPYLVYRRLHPLYSTYRHLGVYQRHLETFEEKPVLRNETINHGCVNCHTPFTGDSGRSAVSLRGRYGAPTFLIDGKQISRIDTKMGYLSWHPSGKLLAFADNEITQFFHLAGPVNRDVSDARSDINVFHVKDRKVEKPAALASSDHNENWPSWAPDGRYLYYCRAPKVGLHDVSNFRYDLFRIPYDPDQNAWGKPETIISGEDRRLSVHQPRVSPDGRHLVLTISDCGSFPLFRPDSDLYLLRLETRALEPLPINSKHPETWHSWSSNGRWLVFGSRRLDGVFSRVMLTHVDPAGHFSKPLLLPQEDPAYYDTCLDNFNAPELARGPVQISEDELARAYNSPQTKAEPAGQQPSATSRAPGGHSELGNPYP